MAYQEKKQLVEEERGIEPILKIIRQLIDKWWLIVAFALAFSVTGFVVAKATYTESYKSSIIFNISNKDKDIVGTAGTYTTASDAQASATLANNFKTLVQEGNDFVEEVQKIVESTTGKEISTDTLSAMMSVEVFTDTTLIKISVRSGDKDLAYAVSTAIQSVYPEFTKDIFQTANISVADNATESELISDSSTLIYTAFGFLFGAALAVLVILVLAKIKNKLLTAEDFKKNFKNIDILATV